MTKHHEDRCQACAAATANGATLCTSCVEILRADLMLVEWLAGQLDITCSGQRSPTYSPLSKGNASSPEPDWLAFIARAELRRALASAVRYCIRHHVRPYSTADVPARHLGAQARWLGLRAPGLAFDMRSGEIVHAIGRAVIRANAAIDLRPERQYLGTCPACGEGAMYAVRGESTAKCRDCREVASADGLRTQKLAELDDRLCTASEIADLSTYLGLHANRDQVRKRINTWHARGVIIAESHAGQNPRFRFGLVWRLLVTDDARHAS